MFVKTQPARIAETPCPHCDLYTRADYKWCLHCHGALKPSHTPSLASTAREKTRLRRNEDG